MAYIVLVFFCLFICNQVCKHFLVKFCPNSLFTNTKSDLGNCDLVHDEKLREE